MSHRSADDDIDSPPPDALPGCASPAEGLGELLGEACGALARIQLALHYLTDTEIRAHARALKAVREIAASLPAPVPREPVGFRPRRKRVDSRRGRK